MSLFTFISKSSRHRLPLSMLVSLAIPGILIAGFCFAIPSAFAQSVDDPHADPGAAQTEATPEPAADDDYYSSLFAYPWKIPEEAAAGNTFWIEVDLTNQRLYAYRGDQIINAFIVSTGVNSVETVTGTYRIYAKYNKYYMTGPEYAYPDVPYTMFFYKGYSIHGTYWHDNFGTPMSYGCVNMKTEEAAWIYENASVGTYVFIHY